MNQIRDELQKGNLDVEDYLTARFDIPGAWNARSRLRGFFACKARNSGLSILTNKRFPHQQLSVISGHALLGGFDKSIDPRHIWHPFSGQFKFL